MKSFFSTLLLLSLVCASFAQNSLLWKISGHGLDTPSYLFGTIHAICPDDLVMNAAIENAFKESTTLYLEVDISDPQVMQIIQMGMMNPEMKNIKGDIDPEVLPLIDEALKASLGAGIDQLGIMKPWALATVISLKNALDCQQPAQYELILSQWAKEQQKAIKGLETAEFQIALFDNIPYKEQLEWLSDAVEDKEEAKNLYEKMLSSYKVQDVDALYTFILEQEEMEDFSELLLDDRNASWVPLMQEAMRKETCFFAVGAGHLGGKKGVLALLKKQGYELVPVE